MKNFLSLTLVSVLVISACSSNETKVISVEKKTAYTPLEAVHANQKMAIEVEGMSCEHACGGSIRMALKETGAVERVSYDFEDGREKNTAYVSYDDTKISTAKIKEIIESVNDNQFSTGTIKNTPLKPSESTSSPESSPSKSSKSTTSIEMDVPTTSSWKLPNIFQIFARLLR